MQADSTATRVRLRRRYAYDVHARLPYDQPLPIARYDVRHAERNLGWVKRTSARTWRAHKSGFWDVRDVGEFGTRRAAVAALLADENLQGSAA